VGFGNLLAATKPCSAVRAYMDGPVAAMLHRTSRGQSMMPARADAQGIVRCSRSWCAAATTDEIACRLRYFAPENGAQPLQGGETKLMARNRTHAAVNRPALQAGALGSAGLKPPCLFGAGIGRRPMFHQPESQASTAAWDHGNR